MKATDLLIFAIPVLLLLFLFSSQRKRQRAFTDLQDRLEPGQNVLTSSGLYARILSLDDTVAILETAPGQSVRWDRRAIASVVADPSVTGSTVMDDDPGAASSDDPDAPADEK